MSISPEMILREMAAQWGSGTRPSVEKFLQQYPDLKDDTQILLDLIQNEVILREGLKETPSLQEYIQRFPKLEQELRIQWDIDSAIRSIITDQSQSPSTDDRDSVVAMSISDFDVPKQLHTYQIVRLIGRGGMGVVYLARDTQLNRSVAIKLLREVAPSPRNLARFRQEGESASRLHHSNIVQVYQVGQEKNQPYLVFEYVDGISLGDCLKTLKKTANPPSHQAVARMIEQLARAMDYAHQRGVLHRDIKPANILIAREGEVAKQLLSIPDTIEKGTPKLADFGLARQLDQDKELTQTGQIMGTPSYMAPEQAEGKTTGTFTDIYALGATLYQCLTLNPPYSGSTTEAILRKVRNDNPDKPSRYYSIPIDLETICLKCLERDPQNRYTSAGALADDLANYIAGRPIQARPISPVQTLWRWAKRNPSLAFVTLFAILIFLGGSITSTVFAVMESKRSSDLKQALEERDKVNGQLLIEKNTVVEKEMLGRKRLAENLFFDGWSAYHLERNPIRSYHRLSEALDIAVDDEALRESISLHRGAIELRMPHMKGVASLPEGASSTMTRWSLNGNRVAIIWEGAEFARGLILFDVPSLQNPIKIDWIEKPRGVALNAKGDRFAVTSLSGELVLGDATTGKKIVSFPTIKGIIDCQFHPIEDQLLVWTTGGITLYDCKTTQVIRTMNPLRGATFPKFINEGKQIVATGKNDRNNDVFCIWKTETGVGEAIGIEPAAGGLVSITHPMRKEILIGRRTGGDEKLSFTGMWIPSSELALTKANFRDVQFPLGADPQEMTPTGLLRVDQNATDTHELWAINQVPMFVENLGKAPLSNFHSSAKLRLESSRNNLICWQIPEDNVGIPFEMDLQAPGVFHPNGKQYLCRIGQKLYFWNIQKGQAEKIVDLATERTAFRSSLQRNVVILMVNNSPNSKCLFFQTNQPDREMPILAGTWIAISNDGQRAVIPEALGEFIQMGYRYHVWDLNTLTRSKAKWEGKAHFNNFFSEDGKTIWLLGSMEKRDWSTRNAETLQPVTVAGSNATNQSISQCGRFRIIRETGKLNRIYSISDDTLLGEFGGADLGAFHPKYPHFVYRDGPTKKVEIRDYAANQLVGRIINNVLGNPFYSVDGRFLIVRTTEQQAEVYEARTGRLLIRWSMPGLTDIQIDAQSTQLALITGTKTTFKKLPQIDTNPSKSFIQEARTRTGYELLQSGEVAPLPLEKWKAEGK